MSSSGRGKRINSSLLTYLPEDTRAEDYGEDDGCVTENDEVADGDHLEGHVTRQDHDSIGNAVDGQEEAEMRVLFVGREAEGGGLPLVKSTRSKRKECSLERGTLRLN